MQAVGATAYRTDLNGDITVTVTGTAYTVSTAKAASSPTTTTGGTTSSTSTTTAAPPSTTAGQITAAVSNPNPCQYSQVTVSGSLTDTAGQPMSGVTIKTTWHYKSSTPTENGFTSSSGSYAVQRGISSAAAGYSVVVNVESVGTSPIVTASTSFTPVDC